LEGDFLCIALIGKYLYRLQARFAGGFVLENEPTGRGFRGGFGAAETTFRGISCLRNGCGEDAVAGWGGGKERLRREEEFSNSVVGTILSAGVITEVLRTQKMNIKPNSGPSRLTISLVVGLVVLLVVIVLLSRAFGATNDARMATPAPSFSLKIGRGQFVKLGDFKGKALLVCFLATADKPSLREALILNNLLKEHGETNLAVLGLVFEQNGAAPMKTFAEEQGLGFPLYAPDYDMVQGFGGLTAIPTLFVIDKNQNIIQRYVGVTEANILEADLKAIFKQ
jgi:peroxiredoxin